MKPNFYNRVKIYALLFALSIFFLPGLVAGQTASKFCGTSKVIAIPCLFDPDTAPGLVNSGTFGALILAVLQILLLVVGSLSVLFLMIGGIRYVTAHGNEEQAEGAKKTMTHAIIGLVIVVMSFTIISIITNVLVAGSV